MLPTAIIFTVFLFYWILGFAIKCWECRSDNDPKCGDPFDNRTLSITDCDQMAGLEHLPGVRPTMCRKIRQKGTLFFVTSILKQFQYWGEVNFRKSASYRTKFEKIFQKSLQITWINWLFLFHSTWCVALFPKLRIYGWTGHCWRWTILFDANGNV